MLLKMRTICTLLSTEWKTAAQVERYMKTWWGLSSHPRWCWYELHTHKRTLTDVSSQILLQLVFAVESLNRIPAVTGQTLKILNVLPFSSLCEHAGTSRQLNYVNIGNDSSHKAIFPSRRRLRWMFAAAASPRSNRRRRNTQRPWSPLRRCWNAFKWICICFITGHMFSSSNTRTAWCLKQLRHAHSTEVWNRTVHQWNMQKSDGWTRKKIHKYLTTILSKLWYFNSCAFI